jgi:GAF domain-containing protein
MPLDQHELTWIYHLQQLGRTTNEGTDPSEIWRHLLENIVAAFKAGSGCLAEVHGSKRALKIQAGIGLPEGVVGSELAAGSGILGLVVSEGKPRLLNGNLSDDQKLADRLPKRTRPAPWSAMCWPLLVEGKIVGVISVNRSREMEPFSEKDLEKGARLIEFIAVAVENTQLNLKSAKYVSELKEMNRKQALWRKAQEWMSEAQAELEKTGDLKEFCTQAAIQAKNLLAAGWGAILVEGRTNGGLSVFSSNENPEATKRLRIHYEAGLPNSEEARQSGIFRFQGSGMGEEGLLNAIGVTIMMPGPLKGMLIVGDEALPRPFDTNDEIFLSAFSMSVQRSLERIQLLNSLRRENQALKVERDELLSEIKTLNAARS